LYYLLDVQPIKGIVFTTEGTKVFTEVSKKIIMEINLLTKTCIGLAFEVHTALGPGLLESVYKECLFYKIRKAGLCVEKEVPIPLLFEEIHLDCGYRIDLLVENKLVLEIKSVEQIHPVYIAQVLTYLKLGKFHLGLLLNFNVLHLRECIKRIIL